MKRTSALIITLLIACFAMAKPQFVTVKNGHFERNGKPYYYVGTNFWYGAILGSEGQGGNRQRLLHELDQLKAMGIDNLRILVGSDGERGVTTKVEPTLQVAPGVYNDTILAGLDYLLMEMGKRDMVAVLYLNNSWEWSGGYGFYLEHAGEGKAPRPNEAGYPAYMNFVSKYASSEKAHQLFYQYVRDIIGRTNRYTGKKYVDDPAIMSWQIGNEPRAFSQEAKQPFAKWLAEASALIRSLDKNHLVSIGSEGSWGCENDMDLYEQICSDKNIDYMNIHLWPYNWGWAHERTLKKDLQRSCDNTKAYIDEHLVLAAKLNKPVVMEEFGFPRDGFSFSQESTTNVRDAYYRFVFGLVADNALSGGHFAGCNFWGWGGDANPTHQQWQVGDDYTGDPAQEAQGLNSVFSTDLSTIEVIREQVARIGSAGEGGSLSKQLESRLAKIQKNGYMMGHQDDPFYGLTWEWDYGRSDVKETVGDYPGIMGFDLGGIEMGDRKNLDSVPFSRIHDELIAHHERGGIVTLSWHPRNPLTGGTAWDVDDKTVVRSILPGGSQHQKFRLWMSRVAEFVKSLKDKDNRPVPIIFRPWHENNGSWFWWGQNLCSDEEFRGLWNMLQDYMTGQGLTNLLWSYSPNLDGRWTEERFLKRYPGNDRVALIGEDAYQWGTEEDFVKQLNADLTFLSDFANRNGKLLAMTECGLKNMPDATWWTRVLKPAMDKYPICYFLLWRNYKEEYFGPAPSLSCAADFKRMYEAKNVLFLKETKKIR